MKTATDDDKTDSEYQRMKTPAYHDALRGAAALRRDVLRYR
jgi:hypothetical protein